MASVDLRSVRKSYGPVEVIHGVDLTIEDREFVALVGPSGCGKSTLLRMVAGLEEITDGEIAIGDTVVNDVPVRRRDVAMVFQNYALYPHMSVFDNLSFSLRLRRMEGAEVESQVGRASGILGIEGFLKRFPRQLSGGQRQRVAMGRAIVRDPRVFLFDEPLSNLDAKLRVQMRTEIKALHQRLQTTAIYVTHDQVEAMTMADRIVVLNGGHVEQVGAPLDLYDRPANRFVAGFIGSPAMNFLDGVVAVDDGRPVVRLTGGPLAGQTVAAPEASDAREGRAVVLGVRPEHLAPAQEGLPMEVEVVEPTGSETVVIFVPEGADRREGAELCATFYDRVRLSPGDRVRLAPKPAEAHLFDAETGRRL